MKLWDTQALDAAIGQLVGGACGATFGPLQAQAIQRAAEIQRAAYMAALRRDVGPNPNPIPRGAERRDETSKQPI